MKDSEAGEELAYRRAEDYNATRDFTVVNTSVGLSNRYNGKAVMTPPLVRVRQLRVRPTSCPVSAAVESAQGKCYPVYSAADRSEEDILTLGNVTGSSSSDSIMNMSTAFLWNSDLDPSGSGLEKSGGTVPYPGSQVRVISSEPRSMYDASGYYVDLPMDRAEFTSTLAKLRKAEWLDREQTRAVIVQFVSYYPESNIYLQANYLVEMFPSGAVRASASLRPVNLRMYDIRSSQDLALTVLFETVVGLAAYGSIMFDGIRMTWPELLGTPGPGLCTFKSAVSLAIISGSFSRIIFLVLSSRSYFESEGPPDLLGGFIDLNGAADSYNLGFIIDAFVAITLMFRLLSFMHHLPNCDNTRFLILIMRRLAETVAYFACLFLTFLLFIAIFGHGVFGAQMEGYESYQQAVITLTMAVVGQVDFMAHYRVNAYVAVPYMVLYQVGMGMVAAKMFMVVVTQVYVEFLREAESAVSHEEFRQYHWLEILSIVFPCIKRRSGKSGGARSRKEKQKGKKKKKNAGEEDAGDLETGVA